MNEGARKAPLETARFCGLIAAIAFHHETGNFILNAHIQKRLALAALQNEIS
jgi:hypothetical protein